MEIFIKDIEQIERFSSDLHKRLNVSLDELPDIISKMGISGERVVIEFTEAMSDRDIFTVTVLDNILKPKSYHCEILLGSMINPYPGFICDDGKKVKYYSCDGHEMEHLHEYSRNE